MYSLIAIACVIILVSLLFGAPFVPSHIKGFSKVLRESDAKKGDTFYDLGFGTGTILLKAAQTGLKVRGFEINPLLWCIAKFRLRRYDNQLYLRPWQGATLNDADFVFIFTTTYHAKSGYFSRIPDDTMIISFGSRIKSLEASRVTREVGAYTIYDPVVHTSKKR